MIKRPTNDIEDSVLRTHIEFLQDNGYGTIYALDSAPTADAPLLEDDEAGIYSGDLYVRKGSTIYVYASASTITIS